jgi:predicted RNA binding protein YcfA (HicA-like mRNA interferase family)
MTTIFVEGQAWYDKAYESAERQGCADQVQQLIRDWKDGRSVTTSPGTTLTRTRIQRDGYAAIFDRSGGVIIGFSRPDGAPRELDGPRTPAEPRKARRRSGKPRRRGPRDHAEMVEWLREDGWDVERVPSGHQAILNPDGQRVGTIPSTPSDVRSFPNNVSLLRRLTGLELRR